MLWNYLRRYIPSLSKLIDSLKLRSKEYLRENTLHGFIYFINPYRPLWERVIWFICTIASFCAAVGIIGIVWQRFQSTPTLTDLSIERYGTSITYPSIHLCMTSDHLDLTGVPEELTGMYETYYNWDWKPINHSNIKLPLALSRVFQHSTPTCNTLITDCTNQGIATNCSILFVKVVTPVGICCKSLSKKFSSHDEPPTLSFTTDEKKFLNLYLNDLDEPPLRHSPITYRLNRNVEIILESHVTKSADDLRMLSRAQRDCVFADEGPSYNVCFNNCIEKKINKICGCVPWFNINNKNIKECKLNEYLCILKNVKTVDCIHNCYLQCDHISYVFARIANKNTTSIGVWWPNGRFNRKIRFGWLDLLVSFGGIMGLFLGYSILTTVELIYYFSLRFYCGAVIKNIECNKPTKIQVAERKSPKIFHIKYYDYVE